MVSQPESSNRSLPRRLPLGILVPSRRSGKQYRARMMIDGETVQAWGDSPESAQTAWVTAYLDGQGPSPRSRTSSRSSAPETDDAGLPPPPATMAELLERYLRHVRADKGTNTFRSYEGIAENHVIPRFGTLPFPIRRAHAIAWKDELIAADTMTTTIRRRMAVLTGALTYAAEMGWIDASPTAHFPLPRARRGVSALRIREPTPELEIPTEDQVRHFLAAAAKAGDPFLAMWRIAFAQALRTSELCALAEDAPEFGPGQLLEFLKIKRKIVRAKRDGPWSLLVEMPKAHELRVIRAPKSVFRVLVEQAQRMRELRASHPEMAENPRTARWDGYLFQRMDRSANGRSLAGEVYAPDQIPGKFAAALAVAWPNDAERPKWTPHYMRHYALSMLLMRGVTTTEVAAFGGLDERVLRDTYAHVIRRSVRSRSVEAVLQDADLGL